MAMDIDEALALVGGYRRWSLTIFTLIGLAVTMPLAWNGLGIIIVGWVPPHQCKGQGDHSSLNESVPMEMGYDGTLQPSTCKIYINGTNYTQTELCPNGWVYKSEYKTIVTEWDLVCGQNYLAELSQTIMQVGSLAGELLVAFFMDWVGRKKVFVFSFVWMAAFGLGIAFSPTYVAFVSLQACVGMGISLSVNAGFLLMMETFDASMRTFVGVGVEGFWVLFYMILPLLGYIFSYWRHFQLFVALACLVWIPLYWIIPESPLWLIANKKFDETEEILQTMARRNGLKINERLMDRQEEPLLDKKNAKNADGTVKKNTVLIRTKSEKTRADKRAKADSLKFTDLFTDPKMLRHTIISMLLWFANMVVYYGIILMTPTLAGDRFINILLGAVVEIPAYIAAYIICLKLGRRIPTCIVHILAGLFLLAAALVPHRTASGVDLGTLILVLALCGKLFICISFAVILLYTKELFPTNLRGMSAGVSVFIGRIGSMGAPFAVYAAKALPWLPHVILGVISVLVGLCTLLLPETRDCPLPQDLDDIHDMYKKAAHRRRKSVYLK